MWPFSRKNRGNEDLYWSWVADKAMLMVDGKHADYPVTWDAALYVLLSPEPKEVLYGPMVAFLEQATGNNARDEEGHPLVGIELPNGRKIHIALDFSNKEECFRLINKEI